VLPHMALQALAEAVERAIGDVALGERGLAAYRARASEAVLSLRWREIVELVAA
jgi:hypothetical protein